MDNVQKHNDCTNVPSSQGFRSYSGQCFSILQIGPASSYESLVNITRPHGITQKKTQSSPSEPQISRSTAADTGVIKIMTLRPITVASLSNPFLAIILQLIIPKTRLNSTSLLPSSYPGRLASRNSTLHFLLLYCSMSKSMSHCD
jgi:hypothetical protein